MKKIGLIILVLSGVVVLVGGLTGCAKKQEALEEMQQPMSPEDLSRLANQTSVSGSVQSESQVSMSSATTNEAKMEELPPSGPYHPSAKDVQSALKNAGYYEGNVDGKFGPMTKKSVAKFQEANGLQADGKVGPKTWSILSKHLISTTSTESTDASNQ